MEIFTNRFQKKHTLGQNFLVNQGVIQASLQRAQLTAQDVVLEIGPGQGALTNHLLTSSFSHLHLIEYDQTLAPWLNPLAESPKVSLHWGDVLHVDLGALTPTPTVVVANIPYHITTPLIWRLYAQLAEKNLNRLILLVQKEAADRLTAAPKTKQRYPLGVTVEVCGGGKTFMKVSPGSFSPPPKVDSALIELNLITNLTLPSDPIWRALLGHSFAHRRKTLVTSAASFGWDKQKLLHWLDQLNLKLTIRAEELTAAQWLLLHQTIQSDQEALVPAPLHHME